MSFDPARKRFLSLARGAWCAALPLALLAGCHDALDGDDAGGGAQAGRAVYRVPVSKELEPWATYPVDRFEMKQDDGTLHVEYDFPPWLTGFDRVIELEGPYSAGAASIEVVAEGIGTGTCTIEGGRLSCTESLPGLPVDRAEAQARMTAAGLSPEEIAGRLKVTDAFSVDPIGIFEADAIFHD